MKKLETTNHSEWLRRKHSGIGASEIAAVVGLNPYMTPFSLWEKKTKEFEEVPEDEEENEFTFSGHIMEPAIVEAAMKKYGKKLGLSVVSGSGDNILYVHPEKDWAICTPDRMIVTPNDGIVTMEVKDTIMPIKSAEDVPITWFSQMQWQMGIVGVPFCYLAWCFQPSRGPRQWFLEKFMFDQEYFTYLMEEGQKFWDMVTSGTPPPPINSDDVQKLYTKAVVGKTVELPEDYVDDVNRLRTLNKSIKEFTAEKKTIEEKLKMLLLDAEAVTWDENAIVTWKSYTKQQIDKKMLLKNFPEVFKSVLVGINYRMFKVK